INEDGNLYPYADLKASGLDLAHIFFFCFKDWFGVYAGPKYLSGKVESNFKNVENGPIVATDSRNFTGYGALAGMFFSFTGKHIGFDINLEYDGMSLPASYGTDHVWYNGWHLLLGVPFGF
ncbi:MAG: hypothetical protein KDD38_08275, partial [Bdellovibrionales bacterium]|nr:hypothetical protein [Bdellovibrionales bacterium]